MPPFLSNLYVFLMFIPLLALHEAAHALAAHWLGDDEAEAEGHLTLNPLHHIDIWGTLVLPALNVFTGNTACPLGWGRIVPFTPGPLHPRREIVLFALAGPVASLLLAFLLVALRTFLLPPDSAWCDLLDHAAYVSAFIALSHLLPLPPFDGWHLLSTFVPLPEELLHPGSAWWLIAFFVVLSFTPVLPLIGVFANHLLNVAHFFFLSL